MSNAEAKTEKATKWADTNCFAIGFHNMSPREFSKLRDHPAQRNTRLHVADLVRASVLERPLIRHAHVSAVLISGPTISVASLREHFSTDPYDALKQHGFKLDGHTRSLLWLDHSDLVPSIPTDLRVEVFIAASEDEAVRLYGSFDNSAASKGQADTLQSTLRIAGIMPASRFVQGATFRGSIDIALAIQAGGIGRRYLTEARSNLPAPVRAFKDGLDLYDILPSLRAVEHFRSAINALDALDLKPGRPKPPKAPTGAAWVAGYLAILHRDPDKGQEFLSRLCETNGELRDERMDAFFAVHHFDADLQVIQARMSAKQRTTSTRDRMIIPMLLNVYAGWLSGKDWPSGQYPYRANAIIGSFDTKLRDRVTAPTARVSAPRRREEAAGAAVLSL